jgi:nucleotide-binding universal stress UspA family protein
MSQRDGKKAVVGADFGASGDDAIVEGLRFLVAGEDNVLHVLHVLDPNDVVEDAERPALLTEEEVLERAPTLLRERMEQLAFANGLAFPRERVRTHARIGKAVDSMLQVAVDYDADLIIVGTHGRRGIDRLVLGSVAEKLVRTARCPVLVARRKDYSGLEKTPRPDAPYAQGEAPQYRTSTGSVEAHVRTESDSWHPAGGQPTGIRIV